MKFFETHFDDYLVSHDKHSLHPALQDVYKTFPPALSDLKNIIFYGPHGVGKYTQMLAAIRRYSPTELKYEKKISVNYNKNTYFFKISDVHFEVDMSLLGCHSKLLWNEVYTQIVDIILAKAENCGIIVCKYFHEIHSELLDTFYSYMQTFNTPAVNLKFIILTEELSFIPDNIMNCCQLIKVPRPSRTLYSGCVHMERLREGEHSTTTRSKTEVGATSTKLSKDINLSDISNIKILHTNSMQQIMRPHEVICDKIIEQIMNMNDVNFLLLRDILYDMFIYSLDIVECVWYILGKLVGSGKINHDQLSDVLIKTYSFLQHYNNNYRPIYHLESYVCNLMQTVHNLNAETT